VIKQFSKRPPFHSRLRDAEWPSSPDKIGEIFEPRKSYRKLSVLIDAHLLAIADTDTERPNKNLLLSNLLNSDLIQYYRYADNGPPPHIKPAVLEGHDWLKERIYDGWAVAFPFEENGTFWPVTYAKSATSFTDTAVTGNTVQFAEKDESSRVYQDLDNNGRAEKRKKDMLAHEVANQAVQSDVFITDRKYLLEERRFKEDRGLTVCSAEEAVTLLSLYLRAQGEYVIAMPSPRIRHTFNRGLFYWVGTREVLPESWRWFSACVHHASGSGGDKLQRLGGSVLSRIQRAIEARDRVHIALNRITSNDINDDALGNLDHVLMLLMGAIDASARVAHYALGLTTQEKYAGWQNDGWKKQVNDIAPRLSALFNSESCHSSTLQILRLLRNSVHGEALQGITLLAEGRQDTVMRLPKSDEAVILLAMDATGGRDKWGYRPFAPGHDNIQPALLVDMLIEQAIALLNDVMKETPVERLSNIEAANLTNKPPKPDGDKQRGDVFSEWNRLVIRWQLGL